MSHAVYTDHAAVYAYMKTPTEGQTTDETTLLDGYCVDAAYVWERKTDTTHGTETGTAAVFSASGRGSLVWAGDGTIRVRVHCTPLLTVTVADLRLGSVLNSWQAVDATRVYIADSDDPRGAAWVHIEPGYGPFAPPLWVRLTYTAGLAAGHYPAEVVDWNTRYAAWLFRHRDAPYEKVADLATGIVKVPTAMPVDLKCILDGWKRSHDVL